MQNSSRLHAYILVLIFTWTSAHSLADEAKDDMAQEITLTVRAQLDAFADDDAERAFRLATLATQSLAGTPNDFLRVIKQKFSPIYRHRHAHFSAPEIIEGHALQVVQLIDLENLVWIAIYQVEREADGRWRVDGCQLFETESMSI